MKNLYNTQEHEIKFIFSNHRINQVKNILKYTCRPDPKFPRYIVSSIYYDTRELHFLREKRNGDYLKSKFRIRWYKDISNGGRADSSFAEVKYRIGNRREKIRMETPYSGEWLSGLPLDDKELLRIPLIIRSKGINLPYSLFPVFLASYERHGFIGPLNGTRVCLDFNISVPKVNMQMIPRANPFQLDVGVFEVKGEETSLPFPLHSLIDMGCKKTSFSKYLACYQKINRIQTF